MSNSINGFPTIYKHDPEVMRLCLTSPIDAFRSVGKVCETPDGMFVYVDNGSPILLVAHLDSVAHTARFEVGYSNLKGQEERVVIRSPWLDDRLGVYTILWLLPSLGINADILLTEGEESGKSTARYFNREGYVMHDRTYHWMAEFDRRGGDVVMYDYHTQEKEDLLKTYGWKVGWGSFTDICYLTHLGIWGMNIGVGYENYHNDGAYAYMNTYEEGVKRFVAFYEEHKDTSFPHDPTLTKRRYSYSTSSYSGYSGQYGSYDSWYDNEDGRYQRGYYSRSNNNYYTSSSAYDVCRWCGCKLSKREKKNGVCAACYMWFIEEETSVEEAKSEARPKAVSFSSCVDCGVLQSDTPSEDTVRCGCGAHAMISDWKRLYGGSLEREMEAYEVDRWISEASTDEMIELYPEIYSEFLYYSRDYKLFKDFLRDHLDDKLDPVCLRCGEVKPVKDISGYELCKDCLEVLVSNRDFTNFCHMVEQAARIFITWREYVAVQHVEFREEFGSLFDAWLKGRKLEDSAIYSRSRLVAELDEIDRLENPVPPLRLLSDGNKEA